MNTKNKIILVNVLIVLAIIFSDVFIVADNDFVVEETGYINVLFCPENDCQNALVTLIDSSNTSKCAFYDLEDEKIISATKNKKTEILVDEDNFNEYGIKIHSKGLMHNKFCILDEKIVWTGSYNPTNSKNHNNVVIIESATIARNFLEEFEEIKKGESSKTRNQKIIFNGHLLENHFCPEDDCQRIILEKLVEANESIYFLTFTFTDKEIAEQLVEKHVEGIEVKGLMERFQNKYSVYAALNKSGIDVILDNQKEFQHNKVFIIDNETVITGSYNPTKAANTINDENIVIIKQPEIVERYLKLFDILFDQNDGRSLSMNPTNWPE